MISIKLAKRETYDATNNEFIELPEKTIHLEHSLVSISRWESKWCKPFLSKNNKTHNELIDYIKCMSDEPINDADVLRLTSNDVERINNYINAPMTATTITERNGRPSNAIITSELLYFAMINNNIPFECQHWHLNRLIMLIRVCNVKGAEPKKMSKREIYNQNRSLNAARKKQMGTKG